MLSQLFANTLGGESDLEVSMIESVSNLGSSPALMRPEGSPAPASSPNTGARPKTKRGKNYVLPKNKQVKNLIIVFFLAKLHCFLYVIN